MNSQHPTSTSNGRLRRGCRSLTAYRDLVNSDPVTSPPLQLDVASLERFHSCCSSWWRCRASLARSSVDAVLPTSSLWACKPPNLRTSSETDGRYLADRTAAVYHGKTEKLQFIRICVISIIIIIILQICVIKHSETYYSIWAQNFGSFQITHVLDVTPNIIHCTYRRSDCCVLCPLHI